MHAAHFIQDLAVLLLVAGATIIAFRLMKQPVVLGYIVAGIIIGPHTPPFAFIEDQATIKLLAELGIVFLMFTLGLEFSLKKLARVGATAVVAAVLEIVLMIWIGYEIGRAFGWKTMDAIFLGAILAISSTTIIIKALEELAMKRERFAQLIFGILIVEDILAIGLIALLSGIALTGGLSGAEAAGTIGKLSLFLIVSLALGILIVPRLLGWVAKFESNEMLLITVLALCFGFSLLVVKLQYSIALGAFVIGAIMAEAREHKLIERLVEPLKDMFSAIFFVSIGLLLDPKVLIEYWLPILVITVAVVVGKVVSCSAGALLAGNDGRTSMRVGMGLAQIGEFSFIIAALGLSLNVTSAFLFPVAVAVSVITTFLTPYLIRAADPVAARVTGTVPAPVKRVFQAYVGWLSSLAPSEDRAVLAALVRKSLLQVLVNVAMVCAFFIAAGFLKRIELALFAQWSNAVQDTALWGLALLVSLPFLIAIYRKLKALSMLLAEVSVRPGSDAPGTLKARRVVSEVMPVASIVLMMVLIAALSASILPPLGGLAMLAVLATLALAVLGPWFVRLHARLQVALMETLDKPADAGHS